MKPTILLFRRRFKVGRARLPTSAPVAPSYIAAGKGYRGGAGSLALLPTSQANRWALPEKRLALSFYVVCTEFEIRHLFISAGHNYFGQHGKPPGEHAIVEVARIQCVAGKGIAGDRFFDFKNQYKGQITFFEEEVYQDLCLQFGVWDRGPEVFRRNVITRGVRLNELIGAEFEIQGVRLFGHEECRPCYWMDLAFTAGTEDALKGRGGLRTEILADGYLTRSGYPTSMN
jgi:hypothetical protein